MRPNNTKGQVMLLTILLISGGILSIASVTAYVMALRLHLASNINDSTKAIYAADTGIEWSLYQSSKPERAKNHPWSSSPTQTLQNGAQFTSQNQTLYVRGSPDEPGWLSPRCECDRNQNISECGSSFISSASYVGGLCYDNLCLGSLCEYEISIFGQRRSTPYRATSTTDTVSVGRSGNVVRAFQLSL